jgi:hypothetical protein
LFNALQKGSKKLAEDELEKTEYSSFEPMREGGPITFEAKPDPELIVKSVRAFHILEIPK